MSLNLNILIFFSRHRLHLLLKLFAVEEFLMIFHFIWGVSSRYFKLQKYQELRIQKYVNQFGVTSQKKKEMQTKRIE